MNISVRCDGKIEIQILDFFIRIGTALLLTLLFFEVTEALEGPQKKVAKKLESGMRSFSPIPSHTETSVPFGDFFISVSRLRLIHLKGIESAAADRDARSIQANRAANHRQVKEL